MGIIVYIIVLFLWGLVVGGLARLALPGPDPMSLPATAGVGIAGSLIGGLVMWALTGNRNGAGLLVSLVCAVGIVYLVRRSRGQTAWNTRRDPGRTRF
jgi:uncharacterized membrane protein YeaQ/YmgE (transglycosylase-associated protein family)